MVFHCIFRWRKFQLVLKNALRSLREIPRSERERFWKLKFLWTINRTTPPWKKITRWTFPAPFFSFWMIPIFIPINQTVLFMCRCSWRVVRLSNQLVLKRCSWRIIKMSNQRVLKQCLWIDQWCSCARACAHQRIVVTFMVWICLFSGGSQALNDSHSLVGLGSGSD